MPGNPEHLWDVECVQRDSPECAGLSQSYNLMAGASGFLWPPLVSLRDIILLNAPRIPWKGTLEPDL